jgi:hypothetical protein
VNRQVGFKAEGEFCDQVDDKWIVIMRPLGDYDNKPCGRPTPGWPNGLLATRGLAALWANFVSLLTISNIIF